MDKLNSENGFSIVVALALVLVISLIIGEATRSIQYSQKLSGYQFERSKGAAFLERSIGLLKRQLQNNPAEYSLRTSQWHSCEIGEDYRFEFQIIDHDGLIDINVASKELLTLGFEALSFTADNARTLAERVEDYRDRDFLDRNGILEAEHFKSENDEFQFWPRNGPFPTIHFLDQLPGFNIRDHRRVDRVFTTKTGLDGFDPDVSISELSNVSHPKFLRKSRRHTLTLEANISRNGKPLAASIWDLHWHQSSLILKKSLESRLLSGVNIVGAGRNKKGNSLDCGFQGRAV